VTSASVAAWECAFKFLTWLLGKIVDRSGPKSVSPAMNCSGVAVVVW
jgi:hypothetical protein